MKAVFVLEINILYTKFVPVHPACAWAFCGFLDTFISRHAARAQAGGEYYVHDDGGGGGSGLFGFPSVG